MAEHSKIEWTDATWNPVTGCSVVSPGCTNCYAMKLAGTRLKHHPSRKGLTRETKAGPVWTGEVRLNEQWLDQPLRWRRPRLIFVCAHGDLFAEGVPDEWIDRVFAVMALCSSGPGRAPRSSPLGGHIFQVLTKRPQRMQAYCTDLMTPTRILEAAMRLPLGEEFAATWPLPNVWLGVSAEDQARADERIPILLGTPAALRFLSAEPLLGPVDLTRIEGGAYRGTVLEGHEVHGVNFSREPGSVVGGATEWVPGLDWVIAGGESGRGARPMHPDWVRSLRGQCAAAGVPFFLKQWGEWVPQVGAVDGWEIDDDPEISRFDHRDWEGDHWGEPYRPMWCDERHDDTVSRIGKKAAGAMLDGREHREMPDV